MQTSLNMVSSFNLTFADGVTASAVRVQEQAELAVALDKIEVQQSRPVAVVVGGASNLNTTDYACLEQLFTKLLAPLAEELGITVVDGGTDVGVMRLMGTARAKIGATFPLIGVVPEAKVHLPGVVSTSATQSLEPHHTHFVLVPGSKWGDESPWIAETATLLSGSAPSVTILINGGPVSLRDVQESLAEQRLVVVMNGTGRLADRIATAIKNPEFLSKEAITMLEDLFEVHNSQKALALLKRFFRVFDLSESEVQLRLFLKQHFFCE